MATEMLNRETDFIPDKSSIMQYTTCEKYKWSISHQTQSALIYNMNVTNYVLQSQNGYSV